jgi:hypothetical protein
MKDMNAIKWSLFTKDVHALEIGEERIVLVDGRAVKIQLAEVADLDRIHRGMICMD